MKYFSLSIILIILIFMGCKDNSQNTSLQQNSNVFAFSYGYRNSAWGYEHQGGFITQSGIIYTFNYNDYASDTVARIVQDGIITTSEMQELSKAITNSSLTVSADTMTAMLLHFDKVIPTNNSHLNTCGADMGEWYLQGYQRTTDSTYTVVNLYKRGDNRQRNLTPDNYPLICYLGKIVGISIDTASCN